jgi:multidrug transporter EmrE-like cation transporter
MGSYFWILLTIIGNVAGNAMVKLGSSRAVGITDLPSAIRFALHPAIIGGIAILGVTFFIYAHALTKFNLSVAYPIITSITLVGVTIISILYLGEKLTALQITGLVTIVIGVWLVVPKA